MVPIISIPTSLSAGEYSDFAGGTNDKTHRKHSFQKPLRGPRLIILDPELTASTPDSIWLSTGIRAVDHCVETLCSTMAYDETDALAQKALGMLVPGLLRSKHDKKDLEARLDCQLGSVDAMAACTHPERVVELGASHGIGHQVFPSLFDIRKTRYGPKADCVARSPGCRPWRDKLHLATVSM